MAALDGLHSSCNVAAGLKVDVQGQEVLKFWAPGQSLAVMKFDVQGRDQEVPKFGTPGQSLLPPSAEHLSSIGTWCSRQLMVPLSVPAGVFLLLVISGLFASPGEVVRRSTPEAVIAS